MLAENGEDCSNCLPSATIWSMTDHILALLIAERDKLTRAIEALQRPTKPLGRPPKNPVEVTAAADAPTAAAPGRKKRHFSAAQRKAAAERMRQRWAVKKAAARPAAKTVRKAKKAAKAA
jgi:hypothetical protein